MGEIMRGAERHICERGDRERLVERVGDIELGREVTAEKVKVTEETKRKVENREIEVIVERVEDRPSTGKQNTETVEVQNESTELKEIKNEKAKHVRRDVYRRVQQEPYYQNVKHV